jgi:hypothetical protein
MRDAFEVNKFQHAQAQLEQQLRIKMGFPTNIPVQFGLARRHASDLEDAVRYNFTLLTLLDRISLALCCGKELFHQIDHIPAKPGGDEISLRLTHPSDNTMHIDPWPFDVSQLTLSVPCRYIPARPYADDAEYRQVLASAEAQAVEFTLSQFTKLR